MFSPSAANDGDVGTNSNANSIHAAGTPVLAGTEMSSSLRERLKRSGRCYKSPATSKRLCQSSKEYSELSQRISSSPIFRNKSVVDDTNSHTAMTTTSTTRNAACNILDTNDRTVSDTSTDPCKHDIAGCSDGDDKPDATNHLYSKSEYVNVYQSTTPKQCRISCADDNSLTPLREMNGLVEEGSDTYTTPCRKRRSACDTDNSGSSTPVRPTDQVATDPIGQGLTKRKVASLERLAKEEERLRKLRMVKMYRTKNDLTELQRLIDLWKGVSQRALEQLLEQTQEPRATMSSLIDHLQLRHELIGYDKEDDTFV